MARARRPQRRVVAAFPSRACRRRLGRTVLGVGLLLALLVLTSLAAVYFLPAPLLVLPAAAALAAVGYVTVRVRRGERGSDPLLPPTALLAPTATSPPAAPRGRAPEAPAATPAADAVAAPRPRRPVPAWPTRRRRRSRSGTGAGHRAGSPTPSR